MSEGGFGALHHIELWVPSLARAERSWGALLAELGWVQYQRWPAGRSWRLGSVYLVVEQSPACSAPEHDRLRPGLNHLAFHAGTRARVDRLVEAAPAWGWTLLFPDRHPHAGGADTYAAYLADRDGFEVELVADSVVAQRPGRGGLQPGQEPGEGGLGEGELDRAAAGQAP